MLMTQKVDPINLIWLQAQGCTGDTIALLSARDPSLVDVMTGVLPEVENINIVFHHTIMAPWGEDCMQILLDAAAGKYDPFVLAVEGSIPDEAAAAKTGGYYCSVGEKDGKLYTANEVIDMLKPKAAAMVAVGTCACFGGFPAAGCNPTGAVGLMEYLGKNYKSTLGLPVINIAGCPPPGDSIIEAFATLALVARGALPVPELDEYNRPTFLYGATVHENCPRCGYLAGGTMSHHFGEPYCMGLLGCKGPHAHCPVAKNGFAEGFGGCPNVGTVCIGCTEPTFPDGIFSPFLKKNPVMFWVGEGVMDNVGKVKATLHRFVKRKI
jgi:hydrogenase small subunit